jgi:hypothetical protein
MLLNFVVQDGILRPIGNRPLPTKRRVTNPPQDAILHHNHLRHKK